MIIDIPKGRYVPVFSLNPDRPGVADRGGPPSMMVVLFQNLSEDPGDAYLAAGLTEELRVLMGRASHVITASDLTPAASTGGTIDVTDPLREPRTRFVLRGSVRRAGKQLRVTARLTDTRTSTETWAEAFSMVFTPGNLLKVQEKIATRIMVCIADEYSGAVIHAASQDALNKKPNELSSYEAILRFYHYRYTSSTGAHRSVCQALEHAVRNDPSYAMAWAALADVKYLGHAHGLSLGRRRDGIQEAVAFARKAIQIDPKCAYAHIALGSAYLAARQPERVVKEVEALFALCPQPLFAAQAAWLLASAGEWDRALPILKDQMAILANYPAWLHAPLFLDFYRKGEYESALNEASSAHGMASLDWPSKIWEAAALGMLGQISVGGRAIAVALDVRPDFAANPRRCLEEFVGEDELIDHLLKGLEKAGFTPTRSYSVAGAEAAGP